MGMTASYARVGIEDLERIRTDPDHYWALKEMPWTLTETAGPDESERLYVDKDWQVLSWLCSAVGRAEEQHMAALVKVDISIKDDAEFKAALKREIEAMGLSYVDANTLPNDPVLTGIQGRRGRDQKPDIEELGLSASAFTPDEAEALLSALDSLDIQELRERFDVREMEVLDLPSDYEESELDEFYLPQLKRIRTLYARAVAAGQHVVVVIS